MKSIRINFASTSFAGYLHQLSLFALMLMCLVLTLLATFCWHYGEIIQKQHALDDIIKVRQEKIAILMKRLSNTTASKISDEKILSINHAIAQLNLPWSDMFDALESATRSNVALLHIEPDIKRGLVKGIAETKSTDDMITYIEQLKKQAFFNQVILNKHEINELDVNKPIRFQFEAQWRNGIFP